MCEDMDVVVIGPGIGQKPETQRFVKAFCRKIKTTCVIDADALKVRGLSPSDCVYTPHQTEFRYMTKKKIERFASKDRVVLLKGKEDVICDGRRKKINISGNEGMTVGGTGDILAGIVAGLIAQGSPKFEAGCCGAFVNGCVGDILKKRYGYGYLASDFLDLIPKVLFEKTNIA
jgi:NAD(P)H-hydrate epimerase